MAEKYPSLDLGPAKVKGPELRPAAGQFVLYRIIDRPRAIKFNLVHVHVILHSINGHLQ